MNLFKKKKKVFYTKMCCASSAAPVRNSSVQSPEREPVCDGEAAASGAIRRRLTSESRQRVREGRFFAENKHRGPGRREGSCSLTTTCVYREQG